MIPLRRASKDGAYLARLDRLARLVRELDREVARLSEELKGSAADEVVTSVVGSERVRHQEAETALEGIRQLFELNFVDLGRMFGVSRQAVSSWLDRGVPPDQKPKLFTVLNIGELLGRKLKPGRLPAVVRRPATSYGGLSILQMIEADRHEELLESVRESFYWAATA
ncbi:MAG TPA: hypothetical protein VGG06_08475 [Thermoanaerobaculia bacterium]|jgi:hypothetical protein